MEEATAPKQSTVANDVEVDDDVLEERNAHKVIDLMEDRVTIVSVIIPFSIIGVLIRIGLKMLFTYPGAPVFYLVYPQFVGWLVTGLCGSITTFSSWMLATFTDLVGYTAYRRGGFYNVMASMADIGVTIGMSLVGLNETIENSESLVPGLGVCDEWLGINGHGFYTCLCDRRASENSLRGRVCTARNICQMAVVAFQQLQIAFPIRDALRKRLGFTYFGRAAEISTLERRHAYVYAIASIGIGQIAMILTVGTYNWDKMTGGLTPTCQ
ncbi:12711_t:CDS:2 [Acaulospora colombiana]|uniref:12711_t:CDS:1 n=1 Tax=Acaulospora colombiana TaxID=27376 RepID=A0ACA9LBX5_9GLOM|nr:12711_t:CDS:2 [Acaulospora colombiana]